MTLDSLAPSATTDRYQRSIRSLHERLHVERSRDLHLCNAGLGLGGELEELLDAVQGGDRSQIMEEAGDVLSYLVFLADLLGVQVAAWVTEDEIGACVPLAEALRWPRFELDAYRSVTRLQESLKKLVFQQPRSLAWSEAKRDLIVLELRALFFVVAQMVASAQASLSEVMAGNVEKLRERYPQASGD